MTHIAGQRTQNDEADARKRKTAGAAAMSYRRISPMHSEIKFLAKSQKAGNANRVSVSKTGKLGSFFRRWCCELRVRELHGCLRNDRRGFEGCGSMWKTKRDNFPKIEKKFNDSRVLTDLTGPNSINMSFRSTRNFPRLFFRGEVCLLGEKRSSTQTGGVISLNGERRWETSPWTRRRHSAKYFFSIFFVPNSLNFRRKRGDKKFVVKYSFFDCVWSVADEKHWPPKILRCSRRVDYANRAIIKFLRRSDLRCAKQVQATLFTLGFVCKRLECLSTYCWPLLHSK